MATTGSMIVCDANVAVAWAVALPWSDRARHHLHSEPDLVAPDVFVFEVGNSLWKTVRAGTLAAQEALPAYELVMSAVTIVPTLDLRREALSLAIRLQHPI